MFRWLFNWSWSQRRARTVPATTRDAAVFTVRQGKRYKATVLLGWLEQFFGNDMIEEKLSEVGFKEVKVTGSGGKRYAQALWARADTTAPLDPHLTEVSEIA